MALMWRMDELDVSDLEYVATYVWASCGELDDQDPRKQAAERILKRINTLRHKEVAWR